MKKIFSLVVFLMLVSAFFVFAQQQNMPEGTGQVNDQQPEGSGNPEETGNGTQTTQETQNQGENTQIQTQQQIRVQTEILTTENGEQVQVQEQTNNRLKFQSGEVSAETSMQMTKQETQTGTKLQVELSNGKNAEVKLMPDTASEKALERLRIKVCSEENNCQIELKEVGKGEEVKAAYEVKVQKQAKFLGLFKTKMQVQAQVDAENGEIIQEKRPWWSFLAAEVEEQE